MERVGGPPKGDHRLRDDFDDNCKTAHPNGTVAGSALSKIYAKYGYAEAKTTGWKPSCSCRGFDFSERLVVPCTVLDPFLGSGCTGAVAESLGRRWVGLELAADYLALGRKRTAQRGLFA